MPARLLLASVLMLLLTLLTSPLGCGTKPETDKGTVVVNIDWVAFIKFNGITYLREVQSLPYSEKDLQYFDEVQFRVEGNITQLGYQIKNGDAAYLDKGTQIYSIKGYSPDFRLVAKAGAEELYLFEADTSPGARKGADLLDIEGKVKYIGINNPIDGKTELASITETGLVSRLVKMVLEAPVDQTFKSGEGDQLFIAFHLDDGTTVVRSFWSDTGQLSRGILLPNEFGKTIKSFVP